MLLQRTLDLYQDSRVLLREKFTQAEIETLVAAKRSELERSPNNSLGRDYQYLLARGIEEHDLYMKLINLSQLERATLVDALERWWQQFGQKGEAPKLEEVIFR